MEIKFHDIYRFADEIIRIRPTFDQLLIGDEFGMDNRDMLRQYGWFKRGEPFYRSNFRRRRRYSFLGFCNIYGLLEVYHTEGTFDRLTFFECVRKLVNSGKVQPYPGKNSVWIIDGAAIHLDENIVYYLRSVGIRIIFNAAYCPFYSPIEYLFGFIKKALQSDYKEIPGTEFVTLCDTFTKFQNFDLLSTFKNCGYSEDGYFYLFQNLNLSEKNNSLV